MAVVTGSSGNTLIRIIVGLLELWVLAIVLILGAAFLMGLLGANPETPFAAWIYARANNLMSPFSGMFEPIALTGSSVIQPAVLFAAFVYGVIGAVLSAVGRRVA